MEWRFLSWVFVVLALLGMSAAQSTRPNILFILVDDMGYNDLGIMGSPDVKTPNINRLAREGVQFPNGYSMARFCSPARAGTLTGINPARYGHYLNPAHSMEDTEMGLPTNLTLLPQTLRDGGYRTMMLGKWHLGFSFLHHPLNRGFMRFFGFLGGKFPYFRTSVYDSKNSITEFMYGGFNVPSSVKYLTTEFTDRTIQFMTESRNMRRPFFTYLAYNAPHSPYQAPDSDMRDARNAGVAPDRQVHVAMMQNLDANIGRLVNHLRTLGILENTLIIFTNDNGGHKDGASNYPLRDFKSTWFEGGLRIPFFMYWKGTIKRGQTIRHPVTLLDIYPTVQAVARIGPSKQNPDLEGRNLMPHIVRVGRSEAARSGPIHDRILLAGRSSGVIREGRWKLIVGGDKIVAMYDLVADIGETTNLRTHRDHRSRSLAMLNNYLRWNHHNAPEPAFLSDPVNSPLRVGLSRSTGSVVMGRRYTVNASGSHRNGRRIRYSWEAYRSNRNHMADFRHLRSDAVRMSFNARKTSASIVFTETGNWTVRVNVLDGRYIKWAEWKVSVRA